MDIIGKKFGRLTIIRYSNKKSNDHHKYVDAICDCGNKTTLIKDSLTRKSVTPTRSCGCLRNEMASKRNLKDGITAAKNNIFTKYRLCAKKRGYEFNLSIEQFYNLIIQPCHYCKINPNKSTKSLSKYIIKHFLYNGIDRKDNTKGYTIENSLPCCSQCNFAKHNQTYEQFIQYLKRVSKIWFE